MTARKHLFTQKVAKGKGFKPVKRSFAILGPGLITGAADDDPSGISTYSVAGAAYGYGTLWIALLTRSGGCSILVVANVINIGADLGGMAEATQFITGIRLNSISYLDSSLCVIVSLLCTPHPLPARRHLENDQF